jgi:PAS domain S-box-containing protein
MVDPAGTVLAVNTFGAAQLGYTVSELVGQSVLKVFFPDDKDAAGKNLQLCVQTAGQQNKWEIRKVRKDGTLLWVRENAKAVRRSDGNLIVLIACEDISDQKRGEQRLAAQSGVSRVLAESDSLAEASPDLLRTICEAMDWDWGALWSVRQQPERLRCDSVWHASTIDVSEFDAASQKSACARGEGRAGQVWKTRQSLWIADVATDPGFRRGPAAARCGLHTGLACPILLGGEALGIIEFFSRRIREPDEQELATLSAIGSQIGQFIRRKRAEQAVQASEKRFRALIEHSYDTTKPCNKRVPGSGCAALEGLNRMNAVLGVSDHPSGMASGPLSAGYRGLGDDPLHGAGTAPAPNAAAEAIVDLLCAQRLLLRCRHHVPYFVVTQDIA